MTERNISFLCRFWKNNELKDVITEQSSSLFIVLFSFKIMEKFYVLLSAFHFSHDHESKFKILYTSIWLCCALRKFFHRGLEQ